VSSQYANHLSNISSLVCESAKESTHAAHNRAIYDTLAFIGLSDLNGYIIFNLNHPWLLV
ncbi:MAG: hypothetical protein IJT59_07545, partial [Desulfovibrionaceae bacterium]|nr:hypothetical protein [Desulfovibrionaceae bacterium]